MDQALKKKPEALKDLGKIAGVVLNKEPDNIQAASEKAKDGLGEREKELQDVAKKAEDLAKKVGDGSKPVDPKDEQALKDLQKELEKGFFFFEKAIRKKKKNQIHHN